MALHNWEAWLLLCAIFCLLSMFDYLTLIPVFSVDIYKLVLKYFKFCNVIVMHTCGDVALGDHAEGAAVAGVGWRAGAVVGGGALAAVETVLLTDGYLTHRPRPAVPTQTPLVSVYSAARTAVQTGALTLSCTRGRTQD